MKITTPLGTADVSEEFAEKYVGKTDIELIQLLIEQSKRFVDPVLVQILQYKKLLRPGEGVWEMRYKLEILQALEVFKTGVYPQ